MVQVALLIVGIAWCVLALCVARRMPCWPKQLGCAWSVSELDKRENTASHILARFRGFIQAVATLITNIHLPNFAKGGIYQARKNGLRAGA